MQTKSKRGSRLPMAATGLVLVGLLVGAGCTSTAPYSIHPWEEVLFVYAEAASASQGVLSLDMNSGSADKFQASSSLTAGVEAGVARMTGGAAPAPTVLTLTQPLQRNYYLNLSQRIAGVVWFTDSVAAATSMSQLQLRVEVFAGKNRVGGSEFIWTGGNQIGAWIPFYFKFRPEVPSLREGEILSLKITRINGGFDLAFGTGGSRQSLLEFHYYNFDPFASAIYLENRKQVFSAAGAGDDVMVGVEELRRDGAFDAPGPNTFIVGGDRAGNSGALLLLGLFGAPLVGLFAPRRDRRLSRGFLLAGIVFVAAFSGCLSDAGDGVTVEAGDAPKPTATVSYEENETLAGLNSGLIRGLVRDNLNLSVGDAHVSLLGTSLFGRTDKAGRFSFVNVSAGDYKLRIDHQKYVPLEQVVHVQAGKIAHINVTLVRPVVENANKVEHFHDYWGDATSFTYPAVSFLPQSVADLSAASMWAQPYYATAVGLIPLDKDVVMRPGTGVIELSLKWTGGPRELGLRITTPLSSATDQEFVPRPSGDPFRIAIFPNEADPGHQKFTSWTFSVVYPSTSTYTPTGAPLVITGGRVNAQVTIHKAVVPLEPSHRDFWGETDQIKLADKAPLSYSCVGCDLPDDSPTSSYKWPPAKGSFVAPGTMEIRGTMTFRHTYSPQNLVEWHLWYKPANMPTSQVQGNLRLAKVDTRTADSITFTIKPAADEVDQFYQVASNWLFYPGDTNDDIGEQSAHGLLAYPTTFTLTAHAFRDPAWVDNS